MISNRKFVKTKPSGSAIIDAARTISIAISEKGFENAKPSMLREHGRLDSYAFAQMSSYTDERVESVRTGITACKVRLSSNLLRGS